MSQFIPVGQEFGGGLAVRFWLSNFHVSRYWLELSHVMACLGMAGLLEDHRLLAMDSVSCCYFQEAPIPHQTDISQELVVSRMSCLGERQSQKPSALHVLISNVTSSHSQRCAGRVESEKDWDKLIIPLSEKNIKEFVDILKNIWWKQYQTICLLIFNIREFIDI